jgi:uracil-DNA glycosylase
VQAASLPAIPADWKAAIGPAGSSERLTALAKFVAHEQLRGPVYPATPDIFRALELTPYMSVRAVILGQDPYHRRGLADGLAFSVRPGTPLPPTLRNILTELSSTFGRPVTQSGSLEPWAARGVLLLNTVLTVGSEAGSHRGRGWEEFTSAVVAAVAKRPEPIAFLLWGKPAQRSVQAIDLSAHAVLTASHPSPLSVGGFRGKAGFQGANRELLVRGADPIDWSLF